MTVVISPLQSLMKDQTDNLEKQHNITNAVTINGALDPIDRAKAFERVEEGSASILYISPESLRSKPIESLLLGRNVVRFVIDEAHCFSSWGHDFRVEYLYIGDFIKNLQEKKGLRHSIPVSCFTATAKPGVIADIQEHFNNKLSLELKEFRASSARINLSYHIIPEDGGDDKNYKLRQLISDNRCPTIIYVSTTYRTTVIADILTGWGFPAIPYHGKMDKQIRVMNQDAFISGEVDIIVATTAFGMGVDKKDVGMVIHYDISNSLENYAQEAGRAGRDERIRADCYVLFVEEDLDKHFILLNQTKLSRKEIQQVWMALKALMTPRTHITQSALEIARKAGWDDSVPDIEMRVTTAINALEQSGFVRRGQNMPRIFADSILVKNMEEARARIDKSSRFDDTSREQAIRIIGSMISSKRKAIARGEDGESRVDYISDRLGIVKKDVIRAIGLLREERILADAKDLVAYMKSTEKGTRLKTKLSDHRNIEIFLLDTIDDEEKTYNIKEMNEALQLQFPKTSINRLHTILNYFEIKRYIKRTREKNKDYVTIKPYSMLAEIQPGIEKRHRIAEVILDYLSSKARNTTENGDVDVTIEFSVLELKEEFNRNLHNEKAKGEEIEDALYYLLKIGAMSFEGGFLAIYNAMRIERLNMERRAQYLKEHYSKLDKYYLHKRQQIHIVGEYARRLIDDANKGMSFVEDYFKMDYDNFLQKYFEGRKGEISRNITPKKYEKVFGELSSTQRSVIEDHESNYIVVAAGPGSGKTKLLVHKLASLYMMEDVKHEQMLMLTFSRAAATEFKQRLTSLIGGAANFIQIRTFHSYCFDLLGKVGAPEKSDGIIAQAVEKIRLSEVDLTRLTKTVLVIDEAQDMSAAEYSLVETLMEKNDNMKIIAVGDDDQNIYEFRGSSSKYFESIMNEPGAKKYELVENYRSNTNIVEFANRFAATISSRFKTTPITPIKNENGTITVCKLITHNIATPVVNAVMDIKPPGSTCIITRTNDEAFEIVGLLLHRGKSAKLIQSDKTFKLRNLDEIRFFIDNIASGCGSYTVSYEIWQKAKSGLIEKYGESDNLRWIIKLLEDFQETHRTQNNSIYISDFEQFLRESKLEDFFSESKETILVSTIHQTKGREFDNVFLALRRYHEMDYDDKERRAIYVAVTRAKKNLHIFYNDNSFDGIDVETSTRSFDKNTYPAGSLIRKHLTHVDVHLGSFAKFKREIDLLVSGQELSICNTGCFWDDKEVIRFSKKFTAEMNELKRKGYMPIKAYIRHIVFWHDTNKDDEIKIILPNVDFSKFSE